MELIGEALRQWCGDVVHHILHAGEMVDGFNNVVHLHGLEGGGNFIGAVDFLYLGAGQAVAGHAVGAVSQIHLDVFVDAEVIVLAALIDYFLCKGS